jgi:hypothetical protein
MLAGPPRNTSATIGSSAIVRLNPKLSGARFASDEIESGIV